MAERITLRAPEAAEIEATAEPATLNRYRPDPDAIIPTGSTLLNLGLNGGWGLGRMVNLVGDSSAGKTLLAIEACANFAARYGIKDIRYNEAENAFDRTYAESVGFPHGVKMVGDDAEDPSDRRGSRTVEEFEEDFTAWLKPRISRPRPCLYVLDSFDALEAASELKREFGDRQPGAKAALASEFGRKYIADVAKANCLLLIISQLREAIGVMFGETKVRSGGRALDFYSSQIVWLATGKILKDKRAGVEREVGTRTVFSIKKNKLGRPHARAPITIMYNYGVDDETSMIEWLRENKMGAAGGTMSMSIDKCDQALREARLNRDMDAVRQLREELQSAVRIRWMEIEDAFTTDIRKY